MSTATGPRVGSRRPPGDTATERLPRLRFGFLATGPWILGLLVCVLFAFACHYLAQWQWDRRVQKMHEVNRVLENYDDDAVPFAEAERMFTDFDAEDEWTPVTLSGEYLVEETLIARNRPRAGRRRVVRQHTWLHVLDRATAGLALPWAGAREEATA